MSWDEAEETFTRAGHGLNHIAGEYDERGIQRCVICGGVICDDRGAMFDTRCGQPPKGFAPGPVFIAGSMTGCGRDDSLKDCEPVI